MRRHLRQNGGVQFTTYAADQGFALLPILRTYVLRFLGHVKVEETLVALSVETLSDSGKERLWSWGERHQVEDDGDTLQSAWRISRTRPSSRLWKAKWAIGREKLGTSASRDREQIQGRARASRRDTRAV